MHYSPYTRHEYHDTLTPFVPSKVKQSEMKSGALHANLLTDGATPLTNMHLPPIPFATASKPLHWAERQLSRARIPYDISHSQGNVKHLGGDAVKVPDHLTCRARGLPRTPVSICLYHTARPTNATIFPRKKSQVTCI